MPLIISKIRKYKLILIILVILIIIIILIIFVIFRGFHTIANENKNLLSLLKARKLRNSGKFKTLTKLKKSNLVKTKKSDFAKTNSFKTYFIIFKVKITFIYL